jgi:hypothetical protein
MNGTLNLLFSPFYFSAKNVITHIDGMYVEVYKYLDIFVLFALDFPFGTLCVCKQSHQTNSK